jgi:hypothetical protein
MRDRFRGTDRVPVPELWDEIRGRTPSPEHGGPSRILVLVTAIVVAATGITAGAVVFARRDDSTRAVSEPSTSPSTRTPAVSRPESLSCAYNATFDGREYGGQHTVTRPTPGERVGTATTPPCGSNGEGDEFEVFRVDTVDPEVAVTTAGGEIILVSIELQKMPVELRRYFMPPPCDPADEPVELLGTWIGILGADGNTEVDMKPPYDVYVEVREASADAYERADITVRVPESLGMPLTREDVEESLWKGGDIRIVATCLEGPYSAQDGRYGEDGYLAQEIEAYPG